MRDNDSKKENILDYLKKISPGTALRDGLDNIVRAKTGALIVLSDSEEVMKTVDGGFNINSEFNPASIYELAKMDGAIVLSEDGKRILYANAQLLPDSSISSRETGTRHRTAERVAKQTGKFVISISERRNIITLYRGDDKYILKDVNEILNKANQAIQTLEKYKVVLNQAMSNLSALEFEDLVTVFDVTKVLQRAEMVMRVVVEIEKYIIELGNEGRLIEMQLEELTGSTKEDAINIIRDYYIPSEDRDYQDVSRDIKKLNPDDLLELSIISRILGYDNGTDSLDEQVYPKGYRILNKIPRIPHNILDNVIEEFDTLQGILKASLAELDDVEGIGEIRAKSIKDGLRRFQEQSIIDRHI